VASAIPKVDASVGWPSLPCCPFRHPVSVPCPPAETWLVLHFCPSCRPAKRLYCSTHRDRHMPSGSPAPVGDRPDLQLVRTGEGGSR